MFGVCAVRAAGAAPRAQVTFVLTLLLLEAGGNFSDEGRHVLFTAISALMTFVLMVISDLSDSAEGVYAATGECAPPCARALHVHD